jgi:hypothetical protein
MLLLMPTICPAPTTPNRLTSATAARLVLALNERLPALPATLTNCFPAKRVEDIFLYDYTRNQVVKSCSGDKRNVCDVGFS